MHVRLIGSLLLGRGSTDNPSLRRYASILRGGATAVLAKAVAFGAGLITVPLTLRYLGAERYGLWVTLFSILAWLGLADLGLANGLMNALSEAFARQRRDLAREYVAAAVWGLCALALGLAALLAVGAPFLDWQHLMHIGSASVSGEFRLAIGLAAALFVINLPLTVVGRIYIAAQRPELANYWAIANTLAGLAGLAAAVLAQGGLPVLVLAYSGSQTLVAAASAAWLFTRAYPDLVPNRTVAAASFRRVFGVAGAFFVTQIATLMIFQSGNLIVAHNLGPQYVAPYQVTWLLTLYVILPQQLIGASVWATIGEAYAKDDIQWIRGLVKRYALAGLAICGPLVLLLLVAGDQIVARWAGPAARPSRELLVWMSVWAAELVLTQPLIAVLGGTGKLRAYSVFSVIAAAVAVAGGIMSVGQFGSVGVIAATATSYFCLALVPAAYLVAKTLRLPIRQLAHVCPP